MSTERCDKTDFYKSDCSHCRGLDPSPSEIRLKGSTGAFDMIGPDDNEKWFEATHYGECDVCFKRIKPGDRIKWAKKSYPGARVCCKE
jgi:hypothetical protein